MAEIQAPNVSKILAVLIERLGGPQEIGFDEMEKYATSHPTLFTLNEIEGTLRVEVPALDKH